MIGTRGVPARYGGFETAVEEIGRRLVARGHEVTVYCRSRAGAPERPTHHQGMALVHLPAARRRSLETLSHTALSVLHQVVTGPADVAIVFNSANAVFLPLFHLRGTPTATHVDGLEWSRGKWGPAGRRYYRFAESLAVRWSDALIADARGIADYYREEFAAETVEIAYGAPILRRAEPELMSEHGLRPGAYHLVVARFEPENHVDLILRGYLASAARLPLVVVGSSPYGGEHVAAIEDLAGRSDRIRLLGGVWDQRLLDELYAGAASYLHGHSVGGTNPSLLRAMGAGAPVLAYDGRFNREVLAETGVYFADHEQVAQRLRTVEATARTQRRRGESGRERARRVYDWSDVAASYETLCRDLVEGRSARGRSSGRRAGVTPVA